MILKPLHKGIHESPLTHVGVVGLIAEGNLPGLSRRAIHRIPITGFREPQNYGALRAAEVISDTTASSPHCLPRYATSADQFADDSAFQMLCPYKGQLRGEQ